MTQRDDREYLRWRATREREIASAGQDKSIASVHRRLADEYEKRASGGPSSLKAARDA